VQALEEMNLAYPKIGKAMQLELDNARTLLEQER
jgi:hypothetical protein